MNPHGDPFGPATLEWLAGTDLGRRKGHGQYMTPRTVREALLDRVDLFPGMRVLDPGAGTGEFLASLHEREPAADLSGWDSDPEILEYAKRNAPTARLERRSALDRYDGERFDLVIGNPPYFQFRASPELRRRFAPVISGRPNVFALFIQVAMDVVRPGGQVAFVVPPSMNNGAYFEALRNFILDHGAVEHLEILDRNDLFERASTAVQLIVIRAGGRGSRFHLKRCCPEAGFSRTVFSPEPKLIEGEFEGRETLWQLGFEAVTGTVVWNQKRDLLTSRPGPDTVPLIWARDIGDSGLRPDEGRRPRFVRGQTPLRGPALVVNRVVGAVGRGSLRAAAVPDGMEFVAENHVNVIRSRAGIAPRSAWPELLAAVGSPETGDRARRLTGNTQISATELTHMLPLDIPGR